MKLPETTFEHGGKEIEVITLHNKNDNSYEILFIDKATQKGIGAYTVQNQAFGGKGAGDGYDVTKFFEFVVSDFKSV